LADAQKELADAQKELAEAQKELADAQKETTWAVKDLAKQVGGLAGALGGSLEDFACDLVPELLEHHQGMVIASAGPEEIVVAGKPTEFDVVIRGTIGGEPVVVLCEVKAAVSASEVRRFLKVAEPRSVPCSSASGPTVRRAGRSPPAAPRWSSPAGS
jgi:hypothetical protein